MKCVVFLALLGAVAASPSQKIVNGEEARANEYPHIISLQSSYLGIFPWSHICGGTLISENYVLTAAHCVDGQNNLRVELGRHDLDSSSEPNQQRIDVAQIIMHPDYSSNAAGYPNDIAVLRLSSSANLVEGYVETIELAADNTFAGESAVIAGWGKLRGSDSGTAKRLQKVSMPVIANSNCANEWTGVEGAKVLQTHICVFDPSAQTSACNGDSGGPMYCDNGNGGISVCGVTSWGESGCTGSRPSIYGRVSKFASWIRSNSDI